MENGWSFYTVIILVYPQRSANEPQRLKMYLRTCVPSEDADQPAHAHRLISIFTGHIFDSSGPSCSKLTTTLVNDSLKFTSSDTQICWNFLLKKWVQKLLKFFAAKNIRILSIESAKTINEMTLNELTTLWTTGPRMQGFIMRTTKTEIRLRGLCRLIRDLVGRTCQTVRFLTLRPEYVLFPCYLISKRQ